MYIWSVARSDLFGDTTSERVVALPAKIDLPRNVTSIITNFQNVLFLTSDGDVFAQGRNDSRFVVGHDSLDFVFTPTRVALPRPAIQISGATTTFVALLNDSTVWTWGSTMTGAPGRDVQGLLAAPGKVWLPSAAAKVITATGSSLLSPVLVVMADGTLYAWGSNESRRLGIGNIEKSVLPTRVPLDEVVVDAAIGREHSLILTRDGTVWASGRNSSGQLGTGTTESSSTFVRVSGLHSITRIFAADHMSIALDSSGTWFVWGGNYQGVFLDYTMGETIPEPVMMRSPCTLLSTSESHSQNHVRIWPNPADDEVRIRLSETIGNEVTVRLLSVHGLVEFEGRISITHAEHYSDVVIRTSTISTGLYFAEIVDEFGRRWFDRVVILR